MIIRADDFAVNSLFGNQFEHRLEKVDIQAKFRIDRPQQSQFFWSLQTVITHSMANYGPILLFYVSLIVLVVRARTSEGDVVDP